MSGQRFCSEDSGTATVEFVGLIPAFLLVTLIAAQLLTAGFSLWSVSVAARAGARAAHTGRDPAPAVRNSLPGLLAERARVRKVAGGVVVAEVEVPRLIPFLPAVQLEARSGLGSG